MAPAERYQIVGTVGESGMAVVYLAVDTRQNREVAIKRIKPRGRLDAQARMDSAARLVREVQAAANLQHPHIVPVYEVIPNADTPLIVMEYVRGRTLQQAAPLGTPAERGFVLRLMRDCAAALDYAAEQQCLHRDFKPGNVIVDEFGKARVMDFAVTHTLDEPADSTAETATIIEFLSPEQINGSRLDGRSDQYSLAVVGYQLLTGYRVFDADHLGTLVSMILLQPSPPASMRNPELSQAVDEVLAKAMAKRPADRYGLCTEFVAELDARLTAGGPPASKPEKRTTVKMRSRAFRMGCKAGEVRENELDQQRYVWIPAGSFQMGCSTADNECYDDEKPGHPVTLTKGFWIGETPVTEGAYKRYCEAAGKPMPVPVQPFRRKRQDDRLPVVAISWDEAVEYCKWAGGRLPTEAEWEYAARAGTTGARYAELNEIAWHKGNTGAPPPPAGLKQPNAFGLFDMLGNVWEWTADWYGNDYYRWSERQDPQGPPTGNARTMRGGSWQDDPRSARASGRNRLGQSYRYDVIGFRCVML